MISLRNLLMYSSLCIFAISLGACDKLKPLLSKADDKKTAQAQEKRPAMTITQAPAQLVTWPTNIKASGTIYPWEEASIAAKVAGIPISEIYVNVGDVVRKGQILARFDSETIRVELTQTEASISQAKTNLAQANVNRDRALQLKDSGAISDQEILGYKTLATTAKAQLEQVQATLASQRLRLKYTTVTAPDNGIISARFATLGTVVQPGSELFKLIRQGRLEWRAELAPSQLSQVHPGLTAILTLPDGFTTTGRVRKIAPTLNPQTRLGVAYVDISPSPHARASMYVTGSIQSTQKSALTVPGSSIVVRDGKSYVFVITNQIAKETLVTTGQRVGQDVEVTQGLTPGLMVAVRGAGFLSDGDKVRIEQTQIFSGETGSASVVQPTTVTTTPTQTGSITVENLPNIPQGTSSPTSPSVKE